MGGANTCWFVARIGEIATERVDRIAPDHVDQALRPVLERLGALARRYVSTIEELDRQVAEATARIPLSAEPDTPVIAEVDSLV